MTPLASRLSAVLLIFTSLFLYLVVPSFTTSPKELARIPQLVQLPGLSLSTSYLGDRVLEYKDKTNRIYMDVDNTTYSGYVYAE